MMETRKLTQSERAPLGACHYDLDLWPFDSKIYRRLPFFILHLCMKYEVSRSNTFRVIALQRKCGRTDRRTDKVIPMCRYASQATQKPIAWRVKGSSWTCAGSVEMIQQNSLHYGLNSPYYVFLCAIKERGHTCKFHFFTSYNFLTPFKFWILLTLISWFPNQLVLIYRVLFLQKTNFYAWFYV